MFVPRVERILESYKRHFYAFEIFQNDVFILRKQFISVYFKTILNKIQHLIYAETSNKNYYSLYAQNLNSYLYKNVYYKIIVLDICQLLRKRNYRIKIYLRYGNIH